jgi:hypothetical protein
MELTRASYSCCRKKRNRKREQQQNNDPYLQSMSVADKVI